MLLIADIPPNIVLFVLGCFLINHLYSRTRRIPNGLRLPPGPPGKFIVGNVADMPKDHEWETITRWSEQYGELVYVKVLGQPMVFVNSLDAARELFEKRSSIYSNRPDAPMLMLSGWDYYFASMPYGQRWRRHRKTFHQYLNMQAATAYYPIQIKHTCELLRRINEFPEDYLEHMKQLAASIIMEVVYGIKLKPKGDRFIEIAHKALEGANAALVPGAFLVDLLPILKYVPEWMPGANFQKKARIWREPTLEMATLPFSIAKDAFLGGKAEPSMVVSCLMKLFCQGHSDTPKGEESEEEVIRNTAAVAYAAGAGTSIGALTTFILAMVLYPKVQRKAQAELDSVLGEGHLPTFDHRAQLPYVDALCHEVQRWYPVVPLGVPHALTQDDVYKDYFIPQGTIVAGNAWAILHDETIYGPRPEEFEPERFLRPGADIPTAQYGFGRRICPGRYLAGNTLFIVAASMLHVFDISPAKDTNGNEIPVTPLYISGAIIQPEPFRCSIKPRSASAGDLIAERLV